MKSVIKSVLIKTSLPIKKKIISHKYNTHIINILSAANSLFTRVVWRVYFLSSQPRAAGIQVGKLKPGGFRSSNFAMASYANAVSSKASSWGHAYICSCLSFSFGPPPPLFRRTRAGFASFVAVCRAFPFSTGPGRRQRARPRGRCMFSREGDPREPPCRVTESEKKRRSCGGQSGVFSSALVPGNGHGVSN
jgi:hypothetical protein